jgi:hypothetical protein
MFFGTPHYGSGWSALHSTLLNFKSLFTSTSTHIIRLLQTNSEYLRLLQADFALPTQSLEVRYLFEELGVPIAGRAIVLVSRDSAVPDGAVGAIDLNKNHVDMVKFSSTSDPDFRRVVSHLQHIVGSLVDSTSSRRDLMQVPTTMVRRQRDADTDSVLTLLKPPSETYRLTRLL